MSSSTTETLEKANILLETHIKNDALRHHCRMVGMATKAYAHALGLDDAQVLEWQLAGLLHDLDWEAWPDEHPNYAVEHLLKPAGYSSEVLNAILSHAPERTGKHPETQLERYLFACDELSGFMHAVSLMRPEGFVGMSSKSVTKKLKDARFAANVSREDIEKGAELIEKPLTEHIAFLIDVFQPE
jgi:predicted hydrolase (HD superfamily)